MSATTEIRRAITAAKNWDLRRPFQAQSLDAQFQEMSRRFEELREQQEISAELEAAFVEALFVLRLAHKFNEAPTSLDEKLNRLVGTMNRSLR